MRSTLTLLVVATNFDYIVAQVTAIMKSDHRMSHGRRGVNQIDTLSSKQLMHAYIASLEKITVVTNTGSEILQDSIRTSPNNNFTSSNNNSPYC